MHFGYLKTCQVLTFLTAYCNFFLKNSESFSLNFNTIYENLLSVGNFKKKNPLLKGHSRYEGEMKVLSR